MVIAPFYEEMEDYLLPNIGAEELDTEYELKLFALYGRVSPDVSIESRI